MSDLKKQPSINYQIKAANVNVIDIATGELTQMSLHDAIELAESQDMDLVEVAHRDVPVCKIMNYGKFLYNTEKQKKKSATKKTNETKEMHFTPAIGTEDYEVKLKRIKTFLTEGAKVNVLIKMKGRERQHVEISKQLVAKIQKDCEEHINVKMSSAINATQSSVSCLLAPKNI